MSKGVSMIKGLLATALVFSAAGGIWLWSSSAPTDSQRLVLTGSSTVAPLVSEIAKEYEARNPGVRVDVQTGGSSRGIADAARGLADVGMSSRDLKDSETSGMDSHLLARDGVAILVHSDNPISNLSDEQVLGIFTGKIRRWSEVGGHDAPITVVNRADGRSEVEVICDHFDIESEKLHADLISGENQHGIKTVSGNQDAVIYMSVGASEYAIQAGEPLKLLQWDGVVASSETVAAGEFPVSRSLILITPDNCAGSASDFVDFALSDDMHALIKAQYFVPAAR